MRGRQAQERVLRLLLSRPRGSLDQIVPLGVGRSWTTWTTPATPRRAPRVPQSGPIPAVQAPAPVAVALLLAVFGRLASTKRIELRRGALAVALRASRANEGRWRGAQDTRGRAPRDPEESLQSCFALATSTALAPRSAPQCADSEGRRRVFRPRSRTTPKAWTQPGGFTPRSVAVALPRSRAHVRGGGWRSRNQTFVLPSRTPQSSASCSTIRSPQPP
jgi:hypothetical protein